MGLGAFRPLLDAREMNGGPTRAAEVLRGDASLACGYESLRRHRPAPTMSA